MQDFDEYIASNPGSVYARDCAVSNSDVMNIGAKHLVSNMRFHDDEVRPCMPCM